MTLRLRSGLGALLLLVSLFRSMSGAASPVNVTVTQEVINVTIEDGNGQVTTITVPETDVVSVVTAGEQGIPGTPGPPGSGVSSWNDLTDKPIFTRGYDGREIELQAGATHIQWRYLGTATWSDLAALPANGAAGINGINGKTILSGSGVPGSGIGTAGDFYLDTAGPHLYGPKAAGAWPGIYTELVGPQGIQGPEGPPGGVPNQATLFGIIDDPTDGATMWNQQGPTEQATNAKSGTKDVGGNAKAWTDGNGTRVRQCITADSAPAFKMLSPSGVVIYSVSCDNTMTFTGTVTIQ